MISQKTIKVYAANQPLIISETFANLIGNNDEIAQSAIDGYLKPFTEHLKMCDLSIQDFEDLESLIDVYRGRSLEYKKKNKILQFCFKWVVDSLYEKIVGIPYTKLNKEDQRLIGEALFLASVYRKIGTM